MFSARREKGASRVLTTWSLTPKCPQQIEKALQTGQLYFAIGAVGGMKTAAVLLTIFPPTQPGTDFFFLVFIAVKDSFNNDVYNFSTTGRIIYIYSSKPWQ